MSARTNPTGSWWPSQRPRQRRRASGAPLTGVGGPVLWSRAIPGVGVWRLLCRPGRQRPAGAPCPRRRATRAPATACAGAAGLLRAWAGSLPTSASFHTPCRHTLGGVDEPTCQWRASWRASRTWSRPTRLRSRRSASRQRCRRSWPAGLPSSPWSSVTWVVSHLRLACSLEPMRAGGTCRYWQPEKNFRIESRGKSLISLYRSSATVVSPSILPSALSGRRTPRGAACAI